MIECTRQQTHLIVRELKVFDLLIRHVDDLWEENSFLELEAKICFNTHLP
jgi:hypothetical protein